MDEMIILESISRRKQLCTDRNTKILKQVSTLKTLPNTSYSIAQCVANFYKIDINTLQQLVKRHRDELISDGYKVISRNEFKNVHTVHFKIPNRGLAVFTKRSVLRIGMLLRDSIVAKLIRSYLLNAEEKITHYPQSKQTLLAMANQLDQHATQLIKNVSQLSDHADQLQCQARMIKAIVSEIYTNRDCIQQVKKDINFNNERIKTLEEIIFSSDQKRENNQYITLQQAKILRQKVKEKGKPSIIWPKFRSYFSINKYSLLTKEKYEDALKWIDNVR